MTHRHHFVGELIGTFMLVFFGCGAVAVTVLFSSHVGLFQVSAVWGLGVSLAIYATRHLSCAHLNPAVSLAMVLCGRMCVRRLPVYVVAQLVGAFVAAAALYLIFGESIARFESIHGIVRGTPESVRTAMMFGEFYPHPSAGAAASTTMLSAALTEGIGTFALVFLVLTLTDGCNLGRPDASLSPLAIGLAVTLIISVLAPVTQAGLNPARDFAPRVFAAIAGWGRSAFQGRAYGSIVVYVLGPIAGGSLAAVLSSKFIEPLMKSKKNDTCT
jgi:glycerol uptake facilitator protein